MLPILIILYILSTYSHSDSPHMNCSRMPPKLGNAHVDFTEETSPPAPSRRSASGMECGDASPLSLSAEQTGIAFIPRGAGPASGRCQSDIGLLLRSRRLMYALHNPNLRHPQNLRRPPILSFRRPRVPATPTAGKPSRQYPVFIRVYPW